MSDVRLTRRQALGAGAVTAVGALTVRAAPASAEGDGRQLLVDVERAPEASRSVYEVALGAFQAQGGRSAGPGAPGRAPEWSGTTLAFRMLSPRAEQELRDWVAGVRHGRGDERSVVVRAVLPDRQALRYRLEGCRPVAFAAHGFEQGVGLVQVLTLTVGRVLSEE